MSGMRRWLRSTAAKSFVAALLGILVVPTVQGCQAANRSIKEMIMRALLMAIATIFVAGCATAPAGEKIAVYDHKNSVTRYANRSAESDFVGTSAKKPSAQPAKPSWYSFGHP